RRGRHDPDRREEALLVILLDLFPAQHLRHGLARIADMSDGSLAPPGPRCHADLRAGALAGAAAASSRIMSAPFSAIMMTAALVLPETTFGMTEASTTRR